MDVDSSQNDDSRIWLNKRLVKAILAGLIVVFGCNIAAGFRAYFMVEPTTFFAEIVTSIVVPVAIIYLIAMAGNEFLKPFGFEGFGLNGKKGDRVGFITVLGLLLGTFIGFVLLLFAMVFWSILKTYVENNQLDGYFDQLTAFSFVGGIIIFLLYRFRSIRRAKES